MVSRILMISTSRELSPQPTLPIGAAWVAQALHLAGFEVRFLDLCFLKHPFKAIEEAIRSHRPQGIAISIRNLDNCDFLASRSFLPEVKAVVDFLKSRSDARILLGGAGVSVMPVKVLEYLDLDYAVVGEGEAAAAAFFACDGEAEAALVPGVVTRSQAHPRPGPEPQGWVMPRMQRWIDTRNYLRLEPVLPVQGKRGCANRCLYCTYQKIEGDVWRLRDPAAVVDEIACSMRETGAREFEFVDSVFNEPEGYLEALLEEILSRELKAKFRVASLAPKGLTKAQVRMMERAGVASLVITPESASDVTLAALRKGFTQDDVHHAAELLADSSIKSLWCFLMGGPMEDAETLATTAAFINNRIGRKDSAFITTGIRIYPGTALHDLALTESVIDPEDDLLMPRFYFSQKITPQQARDALQKHLADLSRCIFLSDTQLRSLGTFRRLGTMLRVPDPFWSYARYMNRISSRSRVISRNWGA